jgi:hypothetical protein
MLTVALSLLLLAAPAAAHDTKEYTMLLKEDGVTPDGVSSGVLVSTDSLFFYNVDSREEVIHRVLIDADGDGEFEGVETKTPEETPSGVTPSSFRSMVYSLVS